MSRPNLGVPLLWLLAIFVFNTVIASPVLCAELNLAAAIQRTLQGHPDLQVFPLKQNQLEGMRQSAALRPPLEVGIEVENFAGEDVYQSFDAAEITVALSSVLELGDKRQHRLNAINAREQKLRLEQQVTALELVAETTRRFVALLAAQSKRDLAVEAEALSQSALQSVQRRVNAGASPRADELRAQAALLQAQFAIAQTEAEISNHRAQLGEMWASDLIDFDRAEGNLFGLTEPLNQQQFAALLSESPQVEWFAQEQVLRHAELRLANSNAQSNLSWQLGVRQFESDNNTTLVAGVALPLFSGRRQRGEIQIAEASLSETQLQQESNMRRLHIRLLTLVTEYKTKYEQVEILRATILPLLQQAQAEANSAYQRGLYGYLELVAAGRELLQAQSNLIEAATQALTLQADIEQLTAKPLTLPTDSGNVPEVSQ